MKTSGPFAFLVLMHRPAEKRLSFNNQDRFSLGSSAVEHRLDKAVAGGSIPPPGTRDSFAGGSPSGKAPGFDPGIPRFESSTLCKGFSGTGPYADPVRSCPGLMNPVQRVMEWADIGPL